MKNSLNISKTDVIGPMSYFVVLGIITSTIEYDLRDMMYKVKNMKLSEFQGEDLYKEGSHTVTPF